MSSTSDRLPKPAPAKTPALLAGRWRSVRAERDALGTRVEVYDRLHDAHGVARVLPLAELDDNALSRLRDDLVAAGRVRHPHLATPTDLELDRRRSMATVVRPRIAGCDAGTLLDAAVASGRSMPELLVLTLLAQLLDALEALHAAALVHGRVSLETVVLEGRAPDLLLADPSRDPRLRLVDVGLAAWLEASRPRRGADAEPAPLAPELARRETLAAPVDVYAAGALAHALLIGSRPLPHPSPGARSLPRDVARLLDALCAPRPEARPTTLEARDRVRALALERLAAWRRATSASRADLAREIARRDEAAVRERLASAFAGAALAGPDDPSFVITARERLRSAVYEGRVDEARDAVDELGLYLGEGAEIDPDVAIASAWLGEQEIFAARRQARKDRTRNIVLWTSAPLVFALALTGVMIAAVLSSGM